MGVMMALSEQGKNELLSEVFNEKRVTLYCPKHMYFGPVKGKETKPGADCPDCWKIFYIHEMATTPRSERDAKLNEIEEIMHQMVEMIDKGSWDFKPYDHPVVEFGVE